MRSSVSHHGATTTMDAVSNSKNSRKEEDEDELESLRLAALESLRAKGLPPPIVLPVNNAGNSNPNQVFQRHYGNQNLIAIIPVDNSSASKSDNSCSPYSSPRSTAHQSDSRVGIGLNARVQATNSNISRPPLLKDPPSFNSVFHKQEVEEKPKPSTKFSRFEDSDSDESEEFEISNSKSDSEEEEFVIEEGEADDLIIEVEDYIVLEETDGEYAVEAPVQEVAVSVIGEQVKPPQQEAQIEKKEEAPKIPEPKKRELITCLPSAKAPVSSPKKIDPPTVEPVRVQRHESDRRIETTEATRRSPKLFSKISVPESSRRKSPPPSVRRRSVDRQRQKSTDLKGGDRPSSGSARRTESDLKRKSRASSVEAAPTTLSHRFSDQWRSTNQSRSPTNDKKSTSGRRSPPQRTSVIERETRKVTTLPDSERDRLESRKRKFESSVHQDAAVKKEGKIRLRTTPSPPAPQENYDTKSRKVESIQTHSRRDEVTVQETKEMTSNEKRTKKGKKKLKEKRQRSKSRSTGDKDDDSPRVKVAKTSDSTTDSQLDLRAELQRRRVQLYDDDNEPRRSRTPEKKAESRRILVLKSPTMSSSSDVAAKPSAEPTGVFSKKRHSTISSNDRRDSSDTIAVVKRGGVQVKKQRRAVLSSPVKADKGRETDPLEDRIRLIRAQNEQIRKRQLEIEADKLQYA